MKPDDPLKNPSPPPPSNSPLKVGEHATPAFHPPLQGEGWSGDGVAATPVDSATLLFIDDEANILAALERLFWPLGYTILTAESGAEALNLLEQQTVDLVISDMRMPQMTGAEVLEQIRGKWPDVVRILLTGYSDLNSTIDAINRGEIYRYIAKPWDDNDIVLIVRDALERKQLLAEKHRLEALTQQQNEELKVLNTSLEDKVRRRTEELLLEKQKLEHANRALAALSEVNHNLVHASVEDDLLLMICQAIVKQNGYRLAWVGYVQHDESKSINIMAHAGYDEGYLDDMQLTWAEKERGMGPSGCAVRSGTCQVCQDIASDPQFLPWRDAALQRGYAAGIALPLLNKLNTVFGILNVYAEEEQAFTADEIKLLEEIAGDLAFGVHGLHIRKERDLALEQIQRQMAQLQDSLEDTVRAVATTVEARDPYTAGHQRRVSEIATAIARDMGLPEEQVNGIHLTAMVHDLGKIHIPAEILSNPGKLTEIETMLIKTHPQAGYDILKDVKFPWPIADIILQHHERLDGSGYPQGLKGNAILLEARILSVADVVEAMSSHRPYRAGLGIEAALDEITRGRGIQLDSVVVDACLRVIKDKGFVFTK